MSSYMKMKLYCPRCEKYYEVDVLVSTNSWMIELDLELKKKAEDGTLFKNFCPICETELDFPKEDEDNQED